MFGRLREEGKKGKNEKRITHKTLTIFFIGGCDGGKMGEEIYCDKTLGIN